MGAQHAAAGPITAACFFLISVSYKLAWTAISSLLSQYSRDYGPQVLLQLNVAYFMPSIPVLLLQAKVNDSMDRKLGGAAIGAILRFFVGLGGLVLLTSTFPSLAITQTRLLFMTAMVGASYGVAFGTSYQLASRFPPINTVMLTTGFVSSGPIVLLLDLAIKRGAYYTDSGLRWLFAAVSWLTCMGLLAAVLLVVLNRKLLRLGSHAQHVDMAKLGARPALGSNKNMRSNKSYGMVSGPAVRHRNDAASDMWDHQQDSNGGSHHTVMMMEAGMGDHMHGSTGGSWNQLDYGANGHSKDTRLVSQNSSGGHSERDRLLGSAPDDSKQRKRELPLMSVALRISPAALSIFLSVGTSMLVFPFFTFMKSTGLMGDRLAQVLFYVRLVGDILGRLVPRRLQAATVPHLMFWALLKTAMVPVLFGCIYTPHLTGGDLGAVVVVALFWVLSGYVNTCAYLVAPTLVPLAAKARASGLMTVAFQSSCLIALLGAAAIQQVVK